MTDPKKPGRARSGGSIVAVSEDPAAFADKWADVLGESMRALVVVSDLGEAAECVVRGETSVLLFTDDDVDSLSSVKSIPGGDALGVGVLVDHRASDSADLATVEGADFLIDPGMSSEDVKELLDRRIERARRLIRELEYDALTGLLHRAGFERRMRFLLHRYPDAPGALAMLDLDHFKAVNDEHGHAAGDAVLRWFGDWLCHEFRFDDLISRWGGEEFLVLLPGQSCEKAEMATQRALEHIRDRRVPLPDGTELSVTFSAGIAILEPSGDPGEAIAAADDALYRAKRAGRNQVVVASADEDDGREVLVVDDDADIGEAIAAALEAVGLQAVVVSSAEAAMAKAGANQAACVVTDLSMPGMDGFELIEALRKKPGYQRVPILVVSGHDDESRRVRAFELGADDFIAKPIRLEELVARVRRAIERSVGV